VVRMRDGHIESDVRQTARGLGEKTS
jgi:hypothetical protein